MQDASAWDAIVVGGGPAGATTATLLAQLGRRVALFERSPSARFHVGESLIPATYPVLKRLGLIDWLKQSAFTRKYSVQFVSPDGRESRPFYFFETNPSESACTWQIWRARFDRKLLENASQIGVEVVRGANVTEVMMDGNQAVGVRVAIKGQPSIEARAKVIVDATGQSQLFASRRKLREPIAQLRQASVWTYFKGAHRGKGIDAGATLVLATAGKRGWFWFIPLPGDVTSIGVVSTMDALLGAGDSPEQIYADQLNECPGLQERLVGAKRVKRFFVTKDFSYLTSDSAGDGWVMVGDAFGFLDPVYSTGLLLAFKSGEFAADAIHQALERNDVSANALAGWQARHRQAITSFRKFVYAFYSYQFSFAQFVRQFPKFQGHVVDLLSGDAYKEGIDEIFTVMGDPVPYDGAPPTARTRSPVSAMA